MQRAELKAASSDLCIYIYILRLICSKRRTKVRHSKCHKNERIDRLWTTTENTDIFGKQEKKKIENI